MNQSGDQGFAAGWRQVGVGFMLLVCVGMIAATYGVIAVPLEAEFHTGRAELMFAMTVLSAVSALFAPVAGHLIDRTPIRRLMVLGGCLLGLGYAALSLAQSFGMVLAVFALLIAPANVLIGPVGVTALLARWFARRRAMAVGIAISGVGAGGFIFPFVIQALLDAFAWREAMVWLGAILLACTVPFALLVVNDPADRGLNPDGEPREADAAPATAKPQEGAARRVLGDPAFWLLCLLFGLVTSGMKGTVTNLPPLAVGKGIPAMQAASLVSVYSGSAFIAKISFAGFGDRVPPRRVMLASLLGYAAGMACMVQASGYGMIALGVGLTGLFGGLMVPLQSFIVPRIFGREITGRAMGLMSMVTLVALFSTPPLFGWIYDMSGSYAGIFVFFAGAALAAMLLVPLVRLTPRGQV